MSATGAAAVPSLVRRRRSTELTLVVMAGLITAVAYTLASLGFDPDRERARFRFYCERYQLEPED